MPNSNTSQQNRNAVLILQDGTVFKGKSIGSEGTTTGEICFNTGMTGYQEIFTDPSYFGQIVVMTNDHIGNYGTHIEEKESSSPKISGLVCKKFSPNFSRLNTDLSLQQWMDNSTLVGISDIDTRALVIHIRKTGAQNALISTDVDNIDALKIKLSEVPDMNGLDLAIQVSTIDPYFYGNPDSTIKVAVLDCGIKESILKCLCDRGVYAKVFNAKSTFEEMESWNPNGYFISNGPGDPSSMQYAIDTVKKITSSGKAVFGICLGHQLLALANGISTYKMHHGHRGCNHPVQNLITGKSEITSQNHGFAVDHDSIKKSTNIELTHINLNDNTVEGIRIKGKKAFSVQYHPESSPGPHDSRYLFDDFINNMK